jgi:hypothetical protein
LGGHFARPIIKTAVSTRRQLFFCLNRKDALALFAIGRKGTEGDRVYISESLTLTTSVFFRQPILSIKMAKAI